MVAELAVVTGRLGAAEARAEAAAAETAKMRVFFTQFEEANQVKHQLDQ
jgi:hypothetical protein